MTMVNMSHFMNKDFPPVFLQVFPADDNILHPTERSYLLIVHHKCNPFLQLLMFAGMYQPEETNQRIDIATGKKQNTRQIDQQNNLYPCLLYTSYPRGNHWRRKRYGTHIR